MDEKRWLGSGDALTLAPNIYPVKFVRSKMHKKWCATRQVDNLKNKNIFCPVLCRAVFMLLPADAFHNTPVELRYKDFFVPAYLYNNLYILQLLLSVRP